jgi:hypothetical protein
MAGLLIVFVGVGVTTAVHRDLLASGLSLLLAIVSAAVLYFSIVILRALPSLDEQLADDHQRGGNDHVN